MRTSSKIGLALAAAVILVVSMSFSRLVKHVFSDKTAAFEAPVTLDSAPTKSLYDFSMKSLDGKTVSLSQYKGKKVIILNTASECGYTPQYADWEAFYKQHKDKVVVLGFPANNFGGQEPGSSEQIASFCQKNYGVTFPLFEKIDVVGENQAPLYKWLTTKSMNGWNEQAPKWNFCKYVVDENGKLTHFFASGVKPNDDSFRKAVGI
ncbi:glutathione peroxidase [Fibrella forsythiae]|uniref:Glutathione peroxidase n=1 Tax=Fibrella forsythiae TaxID=2817061 RepID=A0ABS3JCE6_9BACT|nr:glutathione peroxidase [Fibrella forsythiae]MBO0947113.1 glutathione peroxidase [Fibrella forsythiae]